MMYLEMAMEEVTDKKMAEDLIFVRLLSSSSVLNVEHQLKRRRPVNSSLLSHR